MCFPISLFRSTATEEPPVPIDKWKTGSLSIHSTPPSLYLHDDDDGRHTNETKRTKMCRYCAPLFLLFVSFYWWRQVTDVHYDTFDDLMNLFLFKVFSGFIYPWVIKSLICIFIQSFLLYLIGDEIEHDKFPLFFIKNLFRSHRDGLVVDMTKKRRVSQLRPMAVSQPGHEISLLNIVTLLDFQLENSVSTDRMAKKKWQMAVWPSVTSILECSWDG